MYIWSYVAENPHKCMLSVTQADHHGRMFLQPYVVRSFWLLTALVTPGRLRNSLSGMTLAEELPHSRDSLRVSLQKPELIQKVWPIRATRRPQRQQKGAQRGTQSLGAHTPAHRPVRRRHTPHFFLIETFYSRSVSTFSTAISLNTFYPLFFPPPFLSRCLRHGQHVFWFSACSDLKSWMLSDAASATSTDKYPYVLADALNVFLFLFFFKHPRPPLLFPKRLFHGAHCNPHILLIWALFPFAMACFDVLSVLVLFSALAVFL